MKRPLTFLLAVSIVSSLMAAAPSMLEPQPGVIFAHTVRSGATITTPGPTAKSRPFERGETFSASGQTINAASGQAIALVLSNGDALYLPNGGRLTLDEFTQDPVTDTKKNRDYEPSRSTVRLNFAQGVLVVSGRKPVPTSTFSLTTPMLQLRSLSQSLVVRVDTDSVTITLFDGTAEVTIPETGFHDILQAGITATLSRKNLHDSYPLKLDATTTAENDRLGNWVTVARTTESKVNFFGPPRNLEVHLAVPQDFTQTMSVDEPRFR